MCDLESSKKKMERSAGQHPEQAGSSEVKIDIRPGDRVVHRHRSDGAPDKRGMVREVSVSDSWKRVLACPIGHARPLFQLSFMLSAQAMLSRDYQTGTKWGKRGRELHLPPS
jgi:hypothetical protein